MKSFVHGCAASKLIKSGFKLRLPESEPMFLNTTLHSPFLEPRGPPSLNHDTTLVKNYHFLKAK